MNRTTAANNPKTTRAWLNRRLVIGLMCLPGVMPGIGANEMPGLDNFVGKSVDIAPSAYQYRADRKPDVNPPESWIALMKFAGLPLNTKVDVNAPALKKVLCSLLWEEVRQVRRAALASCVTSLAVAAAELRTMPAEQGGPAQIVAWQENLRARVAKLLKIDDLLANGAKTLFVPRLIDSWDMGDYVAKKVRIRSTPGRSIVVIITLPKGGDKPHPAVVCIGGHGSGLCSIYANGKPFADWSPNDRDSSPIYKGFASELARTGYVTIATVVSQHEIAEPGRTLMGERLWDLMRCVGYLSILPEVNKSRIGCGGLSLGGEMTMWLAAMDTRIAAADSSGFLTVMDQMETNHCMCWKFDGLRELVDYADIYALIAPRPLECQNGRKEPANAFTPALAEKAMGEIRPIYASFQETGNVTLDIHDGGHEIDLPALLAFFEKNLKGPERQNLWEWISSAFRKILMPGRAGEK